MIRRTDISWASSFDSFEICCAHSKTDQVGEDAKYPRHLFANPNSPLTCPVLSLVMYFSCCFNSSVAAAEESLDTKLFQGSYQAQRFSAILGRVFKEHEVEIKQLGYKDLSDIGTHSIRKGAVSYLASLPGGPPAAATCLRAGWTMGKVRDIYMRYISSGDQFVGRCLSLLSVLSMEFGSSPPFFSSELRDDVAWAETVRLEQYPHIGLIAGFGRLTAAMCLASLLYHRRWIADSLRSNHVVRVSSFALRSADVYARLESNPELIKVTYPWSDHEHSFGGIPRPHHASLLQEVTCVRDQQRQMMASLVDKVKEALEQFGVDGGHLTAQHIKAILDEFQVNLNGQFARYESMTRTGGGALGDTERVENGTTYRLHFYGGMMHRVPVDWRFPRCGIRDLWRQWWIGDTVRQIPPLRFLDYNDVKHLDKVPMAEDELHHRTGRYKDQRRPVRKTLSDMKFLMMWLKAKVEEANALEEDQVLTLQAVDRMFSAKSG